MTRAQDAAKQAVVVTRVSPGSLTFKFAQSPGGRRLAQGARAMCQKRDDAMLRGFRRNSREGPGRDQPERRHMHGRHTIQVRGQAPADHAVTILLLGYNDTIQ